MKKLVTILMAFAIVSLLTACTDGGNVSDRTDGMISESVTSSTASDAHRDTENASSESGMTATDSTTGSSDIAGSSGITGETGMTSGSEGSAENASGARTANRTQTPSRYNHP